MFPLFRSTARFVLNEDGIELGEKYEESFPKSNIETRLIRLNWTRVVQKWVSGNAESGVRKYETMWKPPVTSYVIRRATTGKSAIFRCSSCEKSNKRKPYQLVGLVPHFSTLSPSLYQGVIYECMYHQRLETKSGVGNWNQEVYRWVFQLKFDKFDHPTFIWAILPCVCTVDELFINLIFLELLSL